LYHILSIHLALWEKFLICFCINKKMVSSERTHHSRLSKNPCFQQTEAGDFMQIWQHWTNINRKKEFFQLQFASFFRFMAANLSLTHLVTAAKPLWCV